MSLPPSGLAVKSGQSLDETFISVWTLIVRLVLPNGSN
jgi:hypothetical protein